jgi:hypothetical protein
MDKKAKKNWVRELRSNQYDQGEGALCQKIGNKVEFCCLGVLLHVEDPRPWQKDMAGDNTYWVGDEYDEYDAELPESFRVKVGITHGEQQCLVDMNDVKKYTFNQIADWIEANL